MSSESDTVADPGGVCPTCGQRLRTAFNWQRFWIWSAGSVVLGALSGVLFTLWWFGEGGLNHWMGLTHVAAGVAVGLIPGLALGVRAGQKS